MDNVTFALTMIIVGMGGTLAVLGLLGVVMALLKKVFPAQENSSN
jgi:Na+-transporting methylmalonyl-CoA/oxaloacetate decarboxylase gamma subunit